MRDTRPNIAVVGGGFTGVAAAIACLAHIKNSFVLTLIEPGSALGRGVAYGGHHPLHLLNVRTRDLSVRAAQPGDFLNWAFTQLDQGENHAGLHDGLAHTFLPRQLFGEYVNQRLFEAADTRRDVDLRLVHALAENCGPEAGGFRIECARTGPIHADVVILATAYGAQKSSAGGALLPFEAVPRERVGKARSIALIGAGLTMVDALMSARRDGFQGTAVVISRRGQMPRPHAPKGVMPQEIALPRSKRVSLLAAALRLACETAEQHGTPWQAIINGLRPSLQQIWQGLPVEEQGQFLRHLRPFWDAHRHRLPIEVHARLQAEFNECRAVLVRGSVTEVIRQKDCFRLMLRRRGSSGPEIVETDLAFDCSGFRPDLDQRLIKSLLERRLAIPDMHRLGVRVEHNGQVLGPGGLPTDGLFAVGPLCQGTLWEITAVPEIVAQADHAARSIAMVVREENWSVALS